LNQKNVDALFNKGRALHNLNQFSNAITYYNSVLQINPRHSKAWRWKDLPCAALRNSKMPQNVSIKRSNSSQLMLIHVHLVQQGTDVHIQDRFEDAIKCYETVIQLYPDHADTWYCKGLASYYLEKYDETIKCCEKALEIDPDYFYAWYGKGLALHSLNKYEEAIKCYDRVIENDPEHIDAWFNKKLATHSMEILKQSKL